VTVFSLGVGQGAKKPHHKIPAHELLHRVLDLVMPNYLEKMTDTDHYVVVVKFREGLVTK
jgi:hypothetical protein